MGHVEPWAHAELYGALGSRGVMDQGSTFGPQGTPIPSQEEINQCTPTPPHILHSIRKQLPTCPHTPYVPMPPHVPAPTSPTCTSHLVFSCKALCSCRLWSIAPYPAQILLCSWTHSAPHIPFTHSCALHLPQLRIPLLQQPPLPQHPMAVQELDGLCYGVPGMVTGVLLSGTVGIDEIPGLGSWRWERRSEGGNRGNTGVLWEPRGGHGVMLGTVGLHVHIYGPGTGEVYRF